MLKELTATCLAFLLCNSAVWTQDSISYKNTFTVTYGIHHLASQDLIFSPFILRDITVLNAGLSYRHESKFLQVAEFQFDSFDPVYQNTFFYFTVPDAEKHETIKNDFTHVKLNYGFSKLFRVGNKYRLYLGVISENTIHAQYYYAGFFGTFAYFASFGLSAWTEFEYDINEKQTVSATAYAPLLAWICRSPYLANDDEFIENISSHNSVKTFFAYLGDGNLQTLNQLQQFNLGLNYQYELNQHWDIGAGYQFNIIHATSPLNLLVLQNGINISGLFKF